MRDEDIDRILGGEEDIQPSSGFLDSVMTTVHREATAPPPIPFPWKRAWPAVAASILVFAVSPVLLVKAGAAGPPVFDSFVPTVESFGAAWIALAALATAGSLLLSRRLCE